MAFVIGLDGVLAAEAGPIDVALVAPRTVHHEGADATAFADDVVERERLVEIEASVDLLEQERAVGVVDLTERRIDTCVGGADDAAPAHRDDVEQPLGVVEEREHALVIVGGEAGDDEMDALRVHDAVIGAHAPLLVQPVDEGSGGVDDDLGAALEFLARIDVAQMSVPPVAVTSGRHQLDVVGSGGTGFDGRPDEREHEPGVVVDEVGVAVLDGSAHARGVDGRLFDLGLLGAEQARVTCPEHADAPIPDGAERGEPRRIWRGLVETGEEADLLDVVGVRLHQPVARPAQLEHQRQLVVLEILEPAPHQVGRLLAGEAAEVAPVHQGHLGAPTGQGSGGDGAVDAASHHQDVERAVAKTIDVRRARCHVPSLPSGGANPAARRA